MNQSPSPQQQLDPSAWPSRRLTWLGSWKRRETRGGDGTINLIHDTVWLVNRSDGRCFPKWPRCHIGKQGENANFHRSPDSGVVPQHMDFEKWYQGPSASTQRCGSHLSGSSVEGALCRETGCGGEQNGGSGLKLASHSGPPLNLRESFGNVFISGTAS